ncbi:MAG TPA: MBL fold metallo-hydrolase [Acidimicrobiales bacterium]|nr:MBL fold metallo-hydrolase [Acidimicrobiales bacterium]
MLLGTAGGPLPSPVRSGIASAVVVGGRVLLVDCGSGVTRQLRRARLLKDLDSVFLTHLHSDHDCDYFNLFLLGWPILQWNPPVRVFGPGPAGGRAALPPDPDGSPAPPLVSPEHPTPGLHDLTALQTRAHAYDLNVRMRDAGRADLASLIDATEIALPAGLDAASPERVAPAMEPMLVHEDADVRVTAILVEHTPVFPSFAFRFDTAAGSAVVSGDTAPSANLVRLAGGADVLVHEVFDDTPAPDRDGEPLSWQEEQQQRHLLSSHTPLSAVGKVAAEAGVGRLVLTHFVPGDDVLPDDHWVKGTSKDFDGEVIAGADLLEVPL